ncbi:MAG: protease inhibitor I42 family protein [Pseudomonadota bacterium]
MINDRADAIRRIISSIVLVAALALIGCASVEAEPQSRSLAAPTPADVALVIKGDSDGQNVTAKVGTTIAVELVGVPTAGYMWAPVATPAFLEAAGVYGGQTSSAQLEPGFAGGNHWEAFLFKVTQAGEGEFRFEQRRPWEDASEAPVSVFSVYLFAEDGK